MKVFLVILSAAVVTAGVTTNERELGEVPEVPAVPEITEVPKVPENKKLPLSDLDKNELDIPNLPEEDDLNVPDLPEDTDLDVPDDETKGDLDDVADLATARNNLSFGTFGSNDRLMSRITHNVASASLLIHDQEITFRGVRGTNITAIRVNQVGSNNPTATRIAGGLGEEFVTIRIMSGRGRSFSYTILVYAEINCSNN